MVTKRTGKSKGNQFEYDVQYNLGKLYSDIYRTSERGFQKQYDLRSDEYQVIIECKNHATFTWNKLKKVMYKLIERTPLNFEPFLIFKSNRQPPLVMVKYNDRFCVYEFEDYFGINFEKHPSTRNVK